MKNKFLKENPEMTDLDTTEENHQEAFLHIIKAWCILHAHEFGIEPELWWRVRERLNIWAEGRATCEGEVEKFVVDHTNRDRVAQGASFILICEKKTVAEELLAALQKERYKLNFVSLAGYAVTDIQEVVLDLAENGENFYILSLHDYDLDGAMIYFNLKSRHEKTIDCGINREFLEWLKDEGSFESRLVEEQRSNEAYRQDIKQLMEEDDNYGEEAFDYLQGDKNPLWEEEISQTHYWVGKRIEIDAIHVQYGIKPFVDYILHRIEEDCKVWDLTRIGIEPFTLDDVDNRYEEAENTFNSDYTDEFVKRKKEIFQPAIDVDNIVQNETWKTNELKEYEDLREKVEKSVEKKLGKIQAKYPNREKDWKEDYEDDLAEINGQLEAYEGDVREAEDNLSEQVSDLWNEADDAALADPDLPKFKGELEKVWVGKDELEKIAVPDKAKMIREVIERLQEELKKMEP